MTPQPHSFRRCLPLAFGLGLANSALAHSGSANFTALSAELLPAAGKATSANFTAEARLNSPPQAASSPSPPTTRRSDRTPSSST